MKHEIRSVDDLNRHIREHYPHMPEYHQAVLDVVEDVIEFLGGDRNEIRFRVLRCLTDPDQVIAFRVNWQDDQNRIQQNGGYRVQFSNALGP